MYEQFPRIIYHSCDLANVDCILRQRLIPGGWPKSSGRFHNYFITMAPWTANARKLAGTRAGKPMYIAFDLELMMQMGRRVFRTDEAILSPDWISNECIVAVYDSQMRDFHHFNRAYPTFRKFYQEKVGSPDPNQPMFLESQMTTLSKMGDEHFEDFCRNVGRGSLKSFPGKGSKMEGAYRDSETKQGQEKVPVAGYHRGPFMGVSNVPQMRNKASRKGWSKGKRQSTIHRPECIFASRLTIPDAVCPRCDVKTMDGHHKCRRCKSPMEHPSDMRLATEVARLESFATESFGTFALDQVTSTQPKSQRIRNAPSSSKEPRRGGRSNYGVIRDSALNYVKKSKKGNYQNLRDRLENDVFFFFNCANNQLTPPCLAFIERLASSISPEFVRSADARTTGKGTEIKTRLIFIPLANRQFDHAIDVTYESQIAHHGRFFSLSQFAVYAGTILNARGEPSPVVHGWSSMSMIVDLTPELNLVDLTNFAKDQWEIAYEGPGSRICNKIEAVATIEKNLPKAFSQVMADTLKQSQHREFDPKRSKWLAKKGSEQTPWSNYKEVSKGKGPSYGKQPKSSGKCHWNQPYGQSYGRWQHQQHQGDYYWNQQHHQWQRSIPGGYAGKGTSSSSSSTSKGKHYRPREEAVEWEGAMYTKITHRDGRVEWLAW